MLHRAAENKLKLYCVLFQSGISLKHNSTTTKTLERHPYREIYVIIRTGDVLSRYFQTIPTSDVSEEAKRCNILLRNQNSLCVAKIRQCTRFLERGRGYSRSLVSELARESGINAAQSSPDPDLASSFSLSLRTNTSFSKCVTALRISERYYMHV